MDNKKTIFITGGTGFIGTYVVKELLARGFSVHALVRSRRESTAQITYFVGDLFDPSVLDQAMTGCAAAIHLVGIIRENPNANLTFDRIHYRASVDIANATLRNGISRYVHMSALGAASDSQSEYTCTKFMAEEHVRKTRLVYTIFRPSLVIGTGGEFTEMMRAWVNYQKAPWVFMPYFGRGLFGQRSARVQPIRVEDVARAFVDAVQRPELSKKTIDLVGPEQMDWPAMYRRAAIAIRGTPRICGGIPIWYARLLTRFLPGFLLPFNRAQLELAAIDNIADSFKLESTLGWQPQPIRFE